MTLLDEVAAVRAPRARRSSWTSGPCRALEHRFTVEAEQGDGFREELDPVVRGLRGSHRGLPEEICRYVVRAVPGTRLPHTLFVDGERLASGRRATDLTTTLTWHINSSAVERSVHRHVLIHASAATLAGVTVILPAEEESGKSTTVAGLLRQGFDYITDEVVAMDPSTGAVTPFPKALSIDPGAWPLFPECRPRHHADSWRTQWHVPPSALGARTTRGTAPPPRVVVFPRYAAGARTVVQPISKGEAVHELARMSFDFRRHAGRNLHLFGALMRQATVVRLTIGELDAAVLCIEQLVSEKLLEAL